MGLKCVSVTVILFAVAFFYVYQQLNTTIELPKLSITQNWGPTKAAKKIPPGISPFKVQYSADVIDNLKKKLSEPYYLETPLEGFRYGFNTNKLREVITYWRDDYLNRWNERQTFLNSFPQFTTEVQGYVCIDSCII